MRLHLLLIVLLLISSEIVAQIDLDDKIIDEKLEKIQEITQTVGFSVAIVHGDEVIYSKGFGYRDEDLNLKVDENTLFPIGSTSKAFTTALLGIMEEENGLSFNDSPRKYIPELEFYNDQLNNEVTILDMVSHRTGLPRHDFSWYLFPTEDKATLVSRVKYQEPFTGIRKKWYYNNFMYLAQGLITEKLTGKSWEDNVRERFFEPLDMSTSNLSIEEMELQQNISKGYILKNFETNTIIPYYHADAISPAGSINSSVKEMANWLKVWLNDGKYNDKQILPKSYVEKAINPLMLIGGGIPDSQFPDQHLNSYGYAWFNSSYKGHYRLEHGGNIDGFSANVALFPTDKIGIIVLSNQNGSYLPTLVRNIISDEVLDLERTDWEAYFEEKLNLAKDQLSAMKDGEKSSKVPNTTPSHSLVEYRGEYTHEGYGTFTIDMVNDSLIAQFVREKAFLEHTHYDLFKPYLIENGVVDEEGIGFNFSFMTNDLGDIEAVKIKMEATLDPLVFTRTPIEMSISIAELEQHAGIYELAGTDLTVSVKDENLMLLVPGQPEYTLIPIKENEYSLKGLTGFKAVFEEKEGESSMILHQPNGVFTAKKK